MIILKKPQIKDLPRLLAFDKRNREHLKQWESAPDENYLERLRFWKKEAKEGKSVRFFIFEKKKLIGMCNLTQIVRGSFQACYLGYKIDHEFEGKGYMFEAVQQTIRYAFAQLKLHRIMANYMPVNLRSAGLLERLGFEIEGFAKNYLLINDVWEDHILTALSYEKWLKPSLKTEFRQARLSDLEAIVALLHDDKLGRKRENTSNMASYVRAFAQICGDPHQEMMVLEQDGKIIGTMQISYLQHLTFQGKMVAHIEAVRIHRDYRRKGFGKRMFNEAFKRIKERGCHRVQLMTDKRRIGSQKFYEQLGFAATHEGMKLVFGA